MSNAIEGIGDFLFGQSGSPAQVVDATPQRFQQMRLPTADRLTQIIDPAQRGGLETFANPRDPSAFTAAMSPQEQAILGQLDAFRRGTDEAGQAREALTRQLAGGGGPNPFAEAVNPFTRGDMGGDFMRELLSGRTLDPSTNPALQASIEAAQRPLIQQFEDQLGQSRADFTRAGQMVQGQASSPFEEARGRLQTDLASEMGDVSTQLVSENLQQERDRQLQAAGLGSQAFEQARQGRISASERAQDRELTAAQSTPGFERTQVEGINQILEAQALPRLIEQQGREQGLQEFRRQQQTLLQALQLATQATAGQSATLPGQPATPGFVQQVGSSFAEGLGQSIPLPF